MADVSQIKLPNGDIFDLVDDSKSTATNWANGSATNSVRTTGSAAESSSYTIGTGAVAEGNSTQAEGDYSHAEGSGSIARGESSHAEGVGTTATGTASHTEGQGTTANTGAHAEGASTTASGQYSHTEGAGTRATSSFSHAEGESTTASGIASHAEGSVTAASGVASHAEGSGSIASGLASHAEGMSTIANHMAQHVFGAYNIADSSVGASTIPGNYVEIVGNGAYNAPSNARTLDWDGNEVLAGKLTVGVAGTNSMDVATVGQIPTVPSDIVNTITTTAGAHTAITSQKGNVSFNVPTTAAHVGIKFEYTTSGNNRAVLQDSSGNLYVTQKDDNSNTTYTLSGALSSHKFTSTLTAGGSGSGTSTSEITFVAGTGITLTDDTTNKKITIATNNSGSVTSVAATGSGGITISGSPITSTGTLAIGLNLSTAINGLSEGSSPAQLNDYAVVQYAGGGTTTTTYHRRKLTNLIVGKAVADQNGLRIDTGYLKLTGGQVTGPTTFGDSVSIDDLNVGQLVVNGSASIVNGLNIGGLLKITNNSNTFTVGSQNASFTHIYNSASIPFIFNNSVLTTTGNLGNTTYPFNNLYIGKANGAGIYYAGTKNTYRMIRFIDNASDAYGNGISIGGGGLTVLGSGESADTLLSNLSLTASGGTETTYIASDGSIMFYPNINSWDASGVMFMTAGRFWVGLNDNTTRENQIGVQSGAGQLYLWSAAATNGSRGLWLPAHGTGAAKAAINIDTNNNVTFNGALSGNATSADATQLPRMGNANTIDVKSAPTQNRAKVQEYGPSCLNLPTSAWYFVETWRGADNNYCAQLALGETTDDAYFRILQNTVWGSWRRITTGARNITMSTSAPSGGSNGDIWFVYS